ncbi:aldolase [Lophium mytilinum]|uniref:Aldolase n=1 Tax=Lophium mytilinum TaxID=390894 RepID=A0A6A6QQU4_9PEZI|nr:aldolase [Lophium mytilinum]
MFIPGLSTSLQQISHGTMPLKGIPEFPSFAEKRNWQLNHMAAAFRYFNRRGYIEGISGHISVRDPEYTNAFWINPLGIHFGLLKAGDMILLDMDTGMVLGGNRSRPANAAGFQIHKFIHLARGDVNAVCLAHTIHGGAYSALGKPLEMITEDACNFYKAHSVYTNYGGVVLGEEESRNITSALGRNKACLLMNHGLLTTGGTVDEAAYLLGLMERCCQVQLLADAATAAGKPKNLIGEHEAAHNFKLTSDPERLYANFQPDYDYEEAMSHGDFKQFDTAMFLD